MLNWFAGKLKEVQEKEKEQGFTLIELLVVIIIIGVLAAIAIPTFLAQRDNAREAAAQSDLRNGATAATACQAANNGSYATCDENNLTANFDWNQTNGVNSTVTTNATIWSATAQHNEGGDQFSYTTNDGRVTRVTP